LGQRNRTQYPFDVVALVVRWRQRMGEEKPVALLRESLTSSRSRAAGAGCVD
jgi:hypothetical protein